MLMKKDNVIPVNQNFQNISDIFVLIYELIAAKIFGDKVSKKYDKTFQVLLIIPIISIFMLHNLFTLGIHRRQLMLSFEERGCQLIDSPFLSDYFTVRTLSTISRTHLSIPKRELFSTIW